MRFVMWVSVGLILVLAAPGVPGRAQDKEKKDDLMRKKLQHSQKVLEGLATNDFDAIGKSADELIAISKEASWKTVKTPRYTLLTDDFQRSAAALAENAKEKNIDAATLSYVELTMTCVKCHKHVRDVRMTRLDP